jgi:hypothetical protein
MATNLGQLHSEPFRTADFFALQSPQDEAAGKPPTVLIPGQLFYRAHREDGSPWNDYCKGLRLAGDDWFIAVKPDDGWILSATQDPTELAMAGADIWRIKHPGPDKAIIAHRWTGKEVAVFPGMEALEP